MDQNKHGGGQGTPLITDNNKSADKYFEIEPEPLQQPVSPLKPPESKLHNVLGLICMFFAQIINALGLAVVKHLYHSNPSLTAFEVTTTRALFQILFNQLIMWYLKLSYSVINREQAKKLFARFAIGYPAWTMLFYSVKVLPIGLSQSIQNLQPFLTLVFAFVILRETVKRLEVVNMVVAFVGVLLMVALSSGTDGISHSSTHTTVEFALAVIANALSTTMISLVNVIIRSLKGLHYSVMAGFQAIVTFIASLVVLVFYRVFINTDYDYSTLTASDWFYLILNGLLQAIMQLLWIKSLHLDKAGRSASLIFLSIVMGYIADYLFFGYHMQWFEIVGAGMIVATSVVVFGMKLYGYSN
ncbi:hypothetical protein FGO68_gene15314 [Halteria grandinella]|uniref:EamA domain-containing protein n=1 Tax=Halteria grandinella TaxID=5974 RepID=A0A8J8NP39_HALGN|nr:hypothetical protein FGO68_gene15314 [Halteria grandinella]